ncbi:NUDIX hydrolase [Adlercreutzia equolifaciens]|uniref:NUDIX hydrolase n=1 Tax=Adlercreutzia equolifaciens TaxID=446660 RepID=A0A6L8Q5A9_9ACTN|nr:NUDIX hydrolase [Adlercreutzia equolifaciens]
MPPTPTLESIETVSTGWINKYHLHYTLPDGRPYTYEGVSRKGPERYEAALEALGSTGAPDPDAVCIVPLLPDGSVLLEREFRYPLNSWCVSLPAGLIDAGESLEEAVARELSEETGYRLRDDIAPAVRPLPQPGFSSTGLTEENVQVVFAQVEAAGKARPDSAELIEPFIVARADLRAFLDANQLPIGTRCQLILELLAL